MDGPKCCTGTLWEGCVELMGDGMCVYRGAVGTVNPLERVPVGSLGVDSKEGEGYRVCWS